MHEHAGRRFECVADRSASTVPDKLSGVTLLTTGFSVKGSLVGHNGNRGASFGIRNLGTVNNQSGDLPFGTFRAVSQKFRRAQAFSKIEPDGFGCTVA